jgi:hypothetical protein
MQYKQMLLFDSSCVHLRTAKISDNNERTVWSTSESEFNLVDFWT